jgi:hypothetical protein
VQTAFFTEPHASSSQAHPIPSSRQDATESDPIRTPTATKNAPSNCVVADVDLAAVVDAWPDLPEAIKAGILAMIKAGNRWSLAGGRDR